MTSISDSALDAFYGEDRRERCPEDGAAMKLDLETDLLYCPKCGHIEPEEKED